MLPKFSVSNTVVCISVHVQTLIDSAGEITSLEPSSTTSQLPASDYVVSSLPVRTEPPSLSKIGDQENHDETSPLLPQSIPPENFTVPLFLRLTFALVTFCFSISLTLYLLSVISSFDLWVSNLFNSTSLFRHHGSTALPVWLFLSSTLISVFAYFPILSQSTLPSIVTPCRFVLSCTFTFSLLIAILVVSNQGLLHTESGLSILAAVWAALASLVGLVSLASGTKVLEKVRKGEMPPLEQEINGDVELGVCNSIKEGVALFLSLISNLVFLFLIFSLFILLTSSLVIRMVDSAKQVPGQRWTVDPFLKSRNGDDSEGVWIRSGRSFAFHLHCRNVPGSPSTEIKRTVLVDAPFGYSGRDLGDWIFESVSDVITIQKKGQKQVDIRVCYFDRPGYGWSDNSPSMSIPHLSRALSQSLAQAGEFSRIRSKNNSSGFILVSTLTSTPLALQFASSNPSYIHSHLIIDGFTPSLYFSPSFFLIAGWGTFLKYGIWRLWIKTGSGWGRWRSLTKGQGSIQRIYAPSNFTISDSVARSRMLEEWDRRSKSSKSLKLEDYPSTVSHTLLTTKGLEKEQEWFVKELMGKSGSIRWKSVKWDNSKNAKNAKEGLGMWTDPIVGGPKCLEALEDLLFA